MLQSQGCVSQIADSPKPWYSTLNMIRFGEYLTPQFLQTFIWAPRVMLDIVFLEGFPDPSGKYRNRDRKNQKDHGNDDCSNGDDDDDEDDAADDADAGCGGGRGGVDALMNSWADELVS